MTKDEKVLLLTVARILKARIPEMSISYQEEDLLMLNEALMPFSPDKDTTYNEEMGAR